MNSQQSPRTVVITGASSGIGLALAEAFLQQGDHVVGNARSESRLQIAAAQLSHPERFHGVAGDIGVPATAAHLIEAAVTRFGRVDVLINNAGIFNPRPFVDYTVEDLDALVDTNLKGFFFASQAAARQMIRQGSGGHIINISASVALQPNAAVPAVLPVLVKGGINSATRALALELAPHNIQVSTVAPGIIDTPLHSPEIREFLKTLQPSGRIGHTSDITNAVLYLSRASFTTGIVLPVDGGMSSGKW